MEGRGGAQGKKMAIYGGDVRKKDRTTKKKPKVLKKFQRFALHHPHHKPPPLFNTKDPRDNIPVEVRSPRQIVCKEVE